MQRFSYQGQLPANYPCEGPCQDRGAVLGKFEALSRRGKEGVVRSLDLGHHPQQGRVGQVDRGRNVDLQHIRMFGRILPCIPLRVFSLSRSKSCCKPKNPRHPSMRTSSTTKCVGQRIPLVWCTVIQGAFLLCKRRNTCSALVVFSTLCSSLSQLQWPFGPVFLANTNLCLPIS